MITFAVNFNDSEAQVSEDTTGNAFALYELRHISKLLTELEWRRNHTELLQGKITDQKSVINAQNEEINMKKTQIANLREMYESAKPTFIDKLKWGGVGAATGTVIYVLLDNYLSRK